MKLIKIGKTDLEVSQIGIGCMRFASLKKDELKNYIETSLDLGLNFYDHADIYGKGACETLFSEAINLSVGASVREKMIIQSKCSIVPGVCYDASKDYILKSTDDILKRLNTDYLDILLLHRPDALVEPSEVCEAFDILKKAGKVRHFGVSNQNPYQIELLNKYLTDKVCVNQLQFSIANSGIVDSGLNVNTANDAAINRDNSILDYCRLKDITIQAWSPFQYGWFEGVFLNNDKFKQLNDKIDEIALKYNVTNSAVAIAWILRHPANIQAIVGTTNISRLNDIKKAMEFTLTREEWYGIYLASGKMLP